MNYYDPKPTKYPFPEITDQHYLVVKKNNGEVFDKDYPYVDKSFGYKLKHKGMRLLLYTLAFPVMRIRTCLKIKGRENLKKHKDVIKQGIVSVINHVHMWDFIGIMRAVLPYVPHIPVWDKNMRGENRVLIRYNNGIPIPVGDMRATHAFSKTIDNLLQQGKWVHFSAEGSMWEFYRPIRPFKKGAFYFAVNANKPVLPMAYTFRKPKGLQKIFHKNPLLTLHIGEPIFPDTTLPKHEAIEKLTVEAHTAVCRLAGFADGENVYPAIFDNTKKVNYY
ncbi:MAG: 1-acyl-sn-glycerol-3-phosphate acyltransferase [Clostridia bacterium]|nr:1-acyl-sn-glycerol-3-phosphate acyltransferase [Clostridia bacterium]